jgi:malonyl-CoA O-methyltransferase
MSNEIGHPQGESHTILPTKEGYDLWSLIYDAEDNPLVAMETAEVGRHMTNLRGLTVADIGCGTGRHALAMAAAGANVTAVDFSEGMLAKARAKPGAAAVRFIQHDLERLLPLESGAYDRIMCGLVIDHIANLEGLFREMRRICKPDGFALVSVMHPAMMLKGVQARFTDPATGQQTRPASVPNQICDYVMAATRAGLHFQHMSEHAVDEALARRSPRAQKYLGWLLLLMMRLGPTIAAAG